MMPLRLSPTNRKCRGSRAIGAFLVAVPLVFAALTQWANLDPWLRDPRFSS